MRESNSFKSQMIWKHRFGLCITLKPSRLFTAILDVFDSMFLLNLHGTTTFTVPSSKNLTTVYYRRSVRIENLKVYPSNTNCMFSKQRRSSFLTQPWFLLTKNLPSRPRTRASAKCDTYNGCSTGLFITWNDGKCGFSSMANKTDSHNTVQSKFILQINHQS